MKNRKSRKEEQPEGNRQDEAGAQNHAKQEALNKARNREPRYKRENPTK